MPHSLVIGGAGFVGANLVRRLLDQGDQVHVLVRPATSLERLREFGGDIAIYRSGLADRPMLDLCLAQARPERVFHLAAENRSVMTPDCAAARRSIDNLANLVTLIEALSAMKRPPKVVVRAGTLAEYGRAPVPYREDCREAPVNPYGASMVAGTHYLAMLEPALPCPVATARLALVYGHGQSENFFVADAIGKCLAGERVTVMHPGDRRDLIHIDDAVAGLLALAKSPPPGASHVNIATGIAPTMREVGQVIAAATGIGPGVIRYRRTAHDEPTSELRADTTRARYLLGWEAKIGLAWGIRQTVAATLEQGLPHVRTA
jgi:nucleoside-diphosphate-sugar epimerase